MPDLDAFTAEIFADKLKVGVFLGKFEKLGAAALAHGDSNSSSLLHLKPCVHPQIASVFLFLLISQHFAACVLANCEESYWQNVYI